MDPDPQPPRSQSGFKIACTAREQFFGGAILQGRLGFFESGGLISGLSAFSAANG
jgi:hypothetical protein